MGLTRREIEGLLAGKLCCFQAGYPEPDEPHICVYFGETNDDVLKSMRKQYPDDTSMQRALGEPKDFRTIPERGDN